VHCIEKNKVIIPLKMDDKCKNNENPTSQEGEGNKFNNPLKKHVK
jgi:hypothetical protein